MSNDLRTEKEILHEIEIDIQEIRKDVKAVNFYLWGEQEGKNINSPYGETTLRGRIGNNVERLLDKKLNKIEEKLDEDTMTYGQFLIYLGIILGIFGGLMAWILLT